MVKFSILGLPDFQYFPLDLLPFDLGRGVRVLRGPANEFLNDETVGHWRSILGSLDWDSFRNRRAFLHITIESENAANDQVNQKLSLILQDAYLALMICAPLRCQYTSAILISGFGRTTNNLVNDGTVGTVTKYKSWGESHFMYSNEYHRHQHWTYLRSVELLNDWRRIFLGLRSLRSKRNKKSAISLGVAALQLGLESQYLDFRIPLFVRAAETIMAPKKNRTKQQFIDRSLALLRNGSAPLFLKRGVRLRVLLDDLFEIRNGSVHGMPFGSKVRTKTKKKENLWRYEYLAEECARRSLRFAISNRDLIKASLDRARLENWAEQYWDSALD